MKDKILIPQESSMDKILSKIQDEEPYHEIAILQVVSRMILFSGRVSQSLERHFQRFGLSQPGFLILMLIHSDSDKKWTAIDLARELHVKPPTMTGILDTLEKGGYISRLSSTEDRRKIFIQISNSGKRKFKKILPEHLDLLQNAFNQVNANFSKKIDDIFLELEKSLNKLTENL